jgi:Dolichyl-phosphate-mannose-protein mannosyltransferase
MTNQERISHLEGQLSTALALISELEAQLLRRKGGNILNFFINKSMQHFLQQHPIRFFWLMALLSLSLHARILPQELTGKHLWRQSQTQINIRNFSRYDFNILNPRIDATLSPERRLHRYEFPLLQWSIAGLQRLLGIEHIALTRICLFLLSLCTSWGFFALCRSLFGDVLLAVLATWAFHFSPLFFYYSINPMPDNLALCGGVWGMAWFFRWRASGQWGQLLLSGLCLSIGVAAKLPFIVFYATPGLYLLLRMAQNRWRLVIAPLGQGLCYSILLAPALIWYAWVIPGWSGNGIVQGVLDNRIPWAEVRRILLDYLNYMLPNSILGFSAVLPFVAGMYYTWRDKLHQRQAFWLLAASGLSVLAYVGFELNMISTVHDYYLMPVMIPVFLLLGYGLKNWWYGSRYTRSLAALVLALCPLLAFTSTYISWDMARTGNNPALIEHRKALQNAVPNPVGPCVMLNDGSQNIFPYALDKFGPVFHSDQLQPAVLADLIHTYQVKYLYSDSRAVDENLDFTPYLDSLLLEAGTIRVFRLRQKQSQ